jgi:hypothetical protein
MLVCGAVFLATSVFAVEWQKESAPFEFPASAVKNFKHNVKGFNLSNGRLCGKNQIVFKYDLPSNEAAVLEVYSISGVKLASLPLAKKTASVIWKTTTKHISGTYTAILKTADLQKTVRFVIAN